LAAIRIPHNWTPRAYQLPAWSYLERGGKRADLPWHRRSGKDEISMHWSAISAIQRPATYWHMLPEAAQARKAIWEAVNPHTGKRRIDEAFPHEIRRRTREQEMAIQFVTGSTWQVVGSDNFNSLVGSPPVGVVLSEWSLANPSAWAYIRPILLENNGWAIRIYTPRGKNHAYRGHEAAKQSDEWFAQKLTVAETGVFTPAQLEAERQELIREYGDTEGDSFFQQEYYCSFDAAILGAVYGKWIARAEAAGRVGVVSYDESVPVRTAWDLGYDDLTAIWWFQIVGNEVHVIDYYQANGQPIEHYADILKAKPYDYTDSVHYGPHDAAHKLLAAGGRSIVAQLRDLGIRMRVVPATSRQNGIHAARKTIDSSWFDATNCATGLDGLKQYHFKWDDRLRILSAEPVHDWSSHPCDAYEIIGQVWREQVVEPEPKPARFEQDRTIHELIEAHRRRKRGE
jgi:phage terminase large subunit